MSLCAAEIQRLIPRQPSALLYVDHIDQHGERLFHLACREDLEGIVAKLGNGTYDCQHGTSWIKIKNAGYTQIVGRQVCSAKTLAGIMRRSFPMNIRDADHTKYLSHESDNQGVTCACASWSWQLSGSALLRHS